MPTTAQQKANAITYFYLHSREFLHPYYWFHFVTRLFLVLHNPEAEKQLNTFYAEQYINQNRDHFWNMLVAVLTKPASSMDPERKKYLRIYPTLRENARYCIGTLFAKKIWGMEFQEKLGPLLLESGAEDTWNRVLSDTRALQVLSTYAINFLYAVNHFLKINDELTLLKKLYAVLNSPWDNTISQMQQKKVYFLTHLIINDSHFYTRKIPRSHYTLHLQHVLECENQLEQDLSDISLDCLCEFVEACKYIDYATTVKKKILKYVLNTHDNLKRQYLTEINAPTWSPDEAEHLNCMFVLAFSQKSTSSD